MPIRGRLSESGAQTRVEGRTTTLTARSYRGPIVADKNCEKVRLDFEVY